jgi:hypothetical protein
MSNSHRKKLALATLLISMIHPALFAQVITPAESPEAIASYGDLATPDAPDIIFSNLDPSPNDRYNSDAFAPFPVAGKNASNQTETGVAILFVPKVDVQAKVLLAAIGYISGTKLVDLGLYTNDDVTGSVGTLLPGGQGSTSQMPDVGVCCQLAKVTLAGDGVSLTAGTKYWLVASADNVNGSTFGGAWHVSNRAKYAYLNPPFPRTTPSAQWAAAQIRGTKVQAAKQAKSTNPESSFHKINASANDITIFTNLGPTSLDRYDFSGGIPVSGQNALEGESWVALPFTPRANVHAKTLAAAVAYESGIREVNLGIYGDNGGTVGMSLPGGQANTVDIPDFGGCCDLTQVTLPGEGVALTKGTQYWLVASPDNVGASDFEGLWQSSNLAISAYEQPESFINWTSFSGGWLAARIQGTSP